MPKCDLWKGDTHSHLSWWNFLNSKDKLKKGYKPVERRNHFALQILSTRMNCRQQHSTVLWLKNSLVCQGIKWKRKLKTKKRKEGIKQKKENIKQMKKRKCLHTNTLTDRVHTLWNNYKGYIHSEKITPHNTTAEWKLHQNNSNFKIQGKLIKKAQIKMNSVELS